MNAAEQELYSDVATLVNRTKEPLEFRWDAKVYVVEGGKKINLPRHIAMKGINACHSKMDPFTGIATESLFGITDDKNYPCTKLGDVDVKGLMESEKLDDGGEVMVDGGTAKKKLVSLKNKTYRGQN
ncbi:MAG: hypothetical protein ACE5DX_05755 [Candidatus Dojkabacteria bacterium]